MSMSSSRFGAALVAGALLLGSAPAFAQQPGAPAGQAPAPGQAPGGQPGAPQGPLKVDLIPTQADWTKVCGHDNAANKDICYTTRDFGAQKDQAPVLALAVYDVKGDDTRIVRFLMPVGLMLRPGFRFAVDKGPVSEGSFEICFPNGCFAEAKIKKDVIDAMKKGTTMTVVVKNQANAEVVFNLPLAGFGKAFDGPAIDPKVLEEQQKKLAAELQKRAEEERKKLEQQQGGAAAPAPAAPAAPAPAPAK
ncbi:invasion associated locus B family protein [Rhodoblastus sp.]|uniref:invasion associated locus B family protein n=1 Tax=Rhodoblastus sp. TaxID=1962975 RepID=UPI0035AFCA61